MFAVFVYHFGAFESLVYWRYASYQGPTQYILESKKYT